MLIGREHPLECDNRARRGRRAAASSSTRSPAARFSSRCATDDVPGISRMLGDRASSQARATCAGVAPSRLAVSVTAGASSTRLTPPNAEPIGKNGTNAMPVALRSASSTSADDAVDDVERVLDARDLGELGRPLQLRERHVADTDATDQSFGAELDHRADLVVELLVGFGGAEDPEVDHVHLVDLERAQVVLDARAQLGRAAGRQPAALLVAAGHRPCSR